MVARCQTPQEHRGRSGASPSRPHQGLAAGAGAVAPVGEEASPFARRADPGHVNIPDAERSQGAPRGAGEVQEEPPPASLGDGPGPQRLAHRDRDVLPHLVVAGPDGRSHGRHDVGGVAEHCRGGPQRPRRASAKPAPPRAAPTLTALAPWTCSAVAKAGMPSPSTTRSRFVETAEGSSPTANDTFRESNGFALAPPVRSVNAARNPARSSVT